MTYREKSSITGRSRGKERENRGGTIDTQFTNVALSLTNLVLPGNTSALSTRVEDTGNTVDTVQGYSDK